MRNRPFKLGQDLERAGLAIALACAALLCLAATASAAPGPTRVIYGLGKIVPIPASIPHEEGDMIDRRIVPSLRWLAERYPIYVTDGYSGPLPNGEHAGCHGCHVKGSDHYNGLAVDIVVLDGGGGCDRAWSPITRLARWAEPKPGLPIAPFRWVGYDGDTGHGCGHHLHLSWNHAVAPQFALAEWVEVFPVGPAPVVAEKPKAKKPAPPKPPPGPSGGISSVRTGGLPPRGD